MDREPMSDEAFERDSSDDEYYNEPCWRCNDEEIVEYPICGWCMSQVLHSSCDDTFIALAACEVCQGGPSEEQVYNKRVHGESY